MFWFDVCILLEPLVSGLQVIGIWKTLTDVQRCGVAAAYLHYTGFVDVVAYEVPTGEDEVDPLFAIVGYKKAEKEL